VSRKDPAVFRALWRGWLVVASKIGQCQSFLILSLVYFLVIAPFALAVRYLVDPLGLRVASSWRWRSRDEDSRTLSFMRQQF
jgi:hypothetical protein